MGTWQMARVVPCHPATYSAPIFASVSLGAGEWEVRVKNGDRVRFISKLWFYL